jgi:hypothetical protein
VVITEAMAANTPNGRETHDEVRELEHHGHDLIDRLRNVGSERSLDRAQREAEEHREDEDLKHFVACHRLHDADREDVSGEILDVRTAGLDVGRGVRVGQRETEAATWLEHVR